jgi:hypoxanthine phosphoribosyltransferase
MADKFAFDVLFDWAALQTAFGRMADAINKDLAGQDVLLMTVMNGGLITAGQLAPLLKVELEFDYLHATRYRGKTSGSHLHWLARPQSSLKGKTVLLVDDILDEGHTLSQVRAYCEENGAKVVKVAALALKIHDRRVAGIEADYVGVEVPDRYVFGCGMDYAERCRNWPGIYALKD